MTYPEQCRTMQHRILHFVFTKACIEREFTHIPGFGQKSIYTKISVMLKDKYLSKLPDNRLVLTEEGLALYNSIIKSPCIPDISLDKAMEMFPVNGEPKTVTDLIHVVYPTFPTSVVRSKARYILERLMKGKRIVALNLIKNQMYYVNVESIHAPKNKKKKEKVEKIEKQDEMFILFYSLLPGTMTAHKGNIKPYTY